MNTHQVPLRRLAFELVETRERNFRKEDPENKLSLSFTRETMKRLARARRGLKRPRWVAINALRRNGSELGRVDYTFLRRGGEFIVSVSFERSRSYDDTKAKVAGSGYGLCKVCQ